MKRVLFLFLLCVISLSGFAQIGKRVQKSDFLVVKYQDKDKGFYKVAIDTTLLTQLNVLKLTYGFNATSINLKTGEFSLVSSTGIGVSKVIYKLDDKGVPYKTWNYGGMFLLGKEDQSSLLEIEPGDKAAFGFMLCGGFGPVTIGPSYFPSPKILLLNFNIGFVF